MIIDKSAHKWLIDNMYNKSYLERYGQYPIGIRFHLGVIDNHNEMKKVHFFHLYCLKLRTIH